MKSVKGRLYMYRSPKGRGFQYWYQTDEAFFEAEKPKASVLALKNEVRANPPQKIMTNPWNGWSNANEQKICTCKGLPINYLATTNSDTVAEAEDRKLLEVYEHLIQTFNIGSPFGLETVHRWHTMVFGAIFPFAGQLRSVELIKGGGNVEAWTWKLSFLNAIPELNQTIKVTSAKHFESLEALAPALGKLMADFLLIHPYREGNGRISRLLNDILLAKNGYPMIGLNIRSKEDYIARVQEGYLGNYEPLTELIYEKVNEQI